MKKSQSGFTLIELVVVIVLLGILGVTALGKFQDLSSDAAEAALEGIAAEITGTAKIAYAKGLIGETSVCVGSGAAAGTGNCAAGATVVDTSSASCGAGILGLLDSVPATLNGQTVAVTADASDQCTGNPAGTDYTCTLTAGTGISATSTLVCTQ